MHPHPCVCKPFSRLFPYSVSSFSPKWHLPTLPLCLHLTLFSHLVLGLVDIRFPRCFPVKVPDALHFFFHASVPSQTPWFPCPNGIPWPDTSRSFLSNSSTNLIPSISRSVSGPSSKWNTAFYTHTKSFLGVEHHVLHPYKILPRSETPHFTPTQNHSSKWNTTFYTHTKSFLEVKHRILHPHQIIPQSETPRFTPIQRSDEIMLCIIVTFVL